MPFYVFSWRTLTHVVGTNMSYHFHKWFSDVKVVLCSNVCENIVYVIFNQNFHNAKPRGWYYKGFEKICVISLGMRQHSQPMREDFTYTMSSLIGWDPFLTLWCKIIVMHGNGNPPLAKYIDSYSLWANNRVLYHKVLSFVPRGVIMTSW